MRDEHAAPILKAAGYVILAAAALVSLFFVSALQPSTAGAAAFFSAWLLAPYAVLALMLTFPGKERVWAIAVVATAVTVAAGGLLFLTDVIFWRPDAQGGIAVLFTPLYQAVAIVVLLPLCHWAFRRLSY